MSKKILITGCEGMLASDLVKISYDAGYNVIPYNHNQLDITNRSAIEKVVSQLQPDIVVNTPGLPVDYCEIEPEKGFQLHAWTAGAIAQLCEKIGSTYVYISTCGLFGDEIKYYSEYDNVVLKTQYSRSKFSGEEIALRKCQRTFVIRPGWLFGGTPQHKRNFVWQRYLEALGEPMISSSNDKFGCPTSTLDLSYKLLEIIESAQYGIYHVANEGRASRYEYVKFIIESFGLDTSVEPVDSSLFPRTALVPDCEMLLNLNIRFLGLNSMDTWQEAIERYIRSIDRSMF